MSAESEVKLGWRDVARFVVFAVATPLVLFLGAGSFKWPMAWVYLVLHVSVVIGSRLLVYRRNPALLAERGRSLHAEDAAPGDRFLSLFVGLLGSLLVWLVAGLDRRFGWSPPVAVGWQVAALAVVTAGYLLGTWAMVVNAFFSAVIRIQAERGQTVVRSGPYRFVRHPAYAGGLWSALAMPVMFGSYWAFIPAGATVLALIVRTSVEDRLLQQALPGYRDYTRETRYRLLPGIW